MADKVEKRILTLYSDVQATSVHWLWYPFIAVGKITLLQGDPGDGKSTMMMNLIAELSKGGKTPDGKPVGTPQRVIYQCSEDVVYVHVMFNNDLKRIVVRGCDENDKDALRWCVAKPDKRKSRKMSCKPFATLVYQKMGWDSECRYKMLGYRITFEGETLYVFDLLVPEIFHEGQRKKNAVDSQDNAASTKPVNSRKGFYLDDIVGTFGVPVEEHRKESEVKQMDGYVSMGILTGKIAPEAGKD